LVKIFSHLNFTPVSELQRQFNHVFVERAGVIYNDRKLSSTIEILDIFNSFHKKYSLYSKSHNQSQPDITSHNQI